MLRVLLVEDHPIVRRGLRDILGDDFPGAEFGEAADAPAALALLDEQQWDVVLLDLNLPGRDGLALLGELGRLRPELPVLVVSAYQEDEFAIRALKLGAAGYLQKQGATSELVAAVRLVLGGGRYMTAAVSAQLANALAGKAERGGPKELSPRELQVLRMVASGRTIKEIAAELGLSEKTIGTYRARLAEKTRTSSNVELTLYAVRHGLVH
jgi:DNA-binding NarL/FixJ family response regulator